MNLNQDTVWQIICIRGTQSLQLTWKLTLAISCIKFQHFVVIWNLKPSLPNMFLALLQRWRSFHYLKKQVCLTSFCHKSLVICRFFFFFFNRKFTIRNAEILFFSKYSECFCPTGFCLFLFSLVCHFSWQLKRRQKLDSAWWVMRQKWVHILMCGGL